MFVVNKKITIDVITKSRKTVNKQFSKANQRITNNGMYNDLQLGVIQNIMFQIHQKIFNQSGGLNEEK